MTELKKFPLGDLTNPFSDNNDVEDDILKRCFGAFQTQPKSISHTGNMCSLHINCRSTRH